MSNFFDETMQGLFGSSGNCKRKYYVNRVGKYAGSHILCRR